MNIACLGWGSLIWDPGSLPLMPNKPRWFTHGPELPVEFARQSAKDRMTLVIVAPEKAEPRPVLWAYLTCPTIEAAHEALARREWGAGSPPRDWIKWKNDYIARWPSLNASNYAHNPQIAAWANGKNLDGVVWTILPPRFDNTERIPTVTEVLNYLKVLHKSKVHAKAEEYIRKAPPNIRTVYRSEVENELGWTCDPSATQDDIRQ